jgi:transcriptional regulator with XRE-family HTH domain
MYRDDVLRAEKGKQRLTTKAIAEKANRSVITVRNVLNGDPNVSVKTLLDVAAALGVDPSELWPRAA